MANQCCQKGSRRQKEINGLKNYLDILNDVNRLRIVCLLKDKKEICVCEIYEALNLSQNLVSYHLSKLKEAGLLESRKAGVSVFYRLGEKRLKDFQTLIKLIF